MPAVWQGNVIDLEGNALPASSIEVREQISGVLVPLFADFAMTVPLGNPFAADDFGFARFFVAANGLYQIKASKLGFTRVWEYVLLINAPTGGYVNNGVAVPDPLVAGNNNDWDSGMSASETIGRIRVEGDAGGSTLTGMIDGVEGKRIILTNVAAPDIIILHESALSLAVNRFNINGDLFWPRGISHEFIYDSAILTGRWSKLGN